MLNRKKRTAGRILTLGMTISLLMTTAWAPAFSAAPETVDKKVEQDELTLPPFSDIEGSYAKEAVERLASFQLISGVEGDRFLPKKAISRQDFAVLLSKVAGVIPTERGKARFIDVTEGSPYVSYVEPLADAGILRGRADGSLGAAEELSRQDLAVLLQRVIEVSGGLSGEQKGPSVSFQDQSQIAGYASDAVNTVTAYRWMIGSNGKFHPLAHVSRAEAAVIADRILSQRTEQAQKVEFSANVKKLTLLAGTSEKIEVKAANGNKLPFTPAFAFDHPEIGRMLPDGTFIAGPNKGTGQITVTVGYKTLQIPVEITPGGQTETTADVQNNTEKKAETTVLSEQTETEKKPAEVEKKADDAVSQQTGSGSTASIENKEKQPAKSDDELINYAADGFFAVKTTGPADSYFHELEMKYPGPVGGLITSSETWTGYARQFGREVTLALPKVKTLQKVKLNFRQDKKQGIFLPADMEVEISKDGKAWFYAGKATHEISASNESPLVRTLEITLPSVDAQYLRVRFPVKIFVFARQLQVLGTEEHRELGTPPVIFAPVRKGKSLEDKKAGERIQNMLLAYSGGYAERGSWTKDDFLPLVGYMSTDGKVLDQMFDSILFLPYPNLASTKGGWEYYLNDLFRPGRQLDALNDAMMEYNKRRGSLYISPTVEKVVLTLPYPDPNQGNFGQIVEDQDSLSFQAKAVGEERAYKYRKQALEWYFQELKKRWDKAEYRYLKLDGIYWFHELVDDAVPRERQLIREMSSMVHNQSLRFYWIPYFGSTGLSEWRELGFDYAFVQPNFYSDKPIPVDRIEATLAVANKYGMGIEVEGDERMVRDMRYYQLYYNQLIAAHKLGIDKDKIHAYYYGSKSLLEAVRSKEANGRAVYDDTYQWMRGRFTKQEYLLPPVTQTVEDQQGK